MRVVEGDGGGRIERLLVLERVLVVVRMGAVEGLGEEVVRVRGRHGEKGGRERKGGGN